MAKNSSKSEPLPKSYFGFHRPLFQTLTIVVVTLLVYRHVFFPWSGLCGGDVIGFHAPFLAALKRSIVQGETFPFWFTELCCGIPAIPDISATLLHPLYQLLRWLDVPTVIKLQLLSNLVILYWGNFHWLRSQRIDENPAQFWALSSTVFFPIQGLLSFGHMGILSSVALLPWALWLVHAIASEGRRHHTVALGLVFGLAWLTGHPQLTLMLHEVALIYFLFLPKSYQNFKGLALFALACVLGCCLASPQLVPTAIHIFQSGRAESLNDAEFLNSGSLGIWQIFRWMNPSIFGEEQSYWGQYSYWYGVLFSGPFLFVLFVRGCFNLPKSVLCGLVICIIFALGSATPLYGLRQHIVPGAKLFRYSSRFIYMASPFILLALCYGGQAFVLNKKIRWGMVGGLCMALVGFGFPFVPQEFLSSLIPVHVLERRAMYSLYSLPSAIMLGQTLAAVAYLYCTRKLLTKLAMVAIFVLQVTLWSQQQFANTQLTNLPSPWEPVPTGRVLMTSDESPNLGLWGGFESLTGYVGMTPKAYRNFLDTQVPQAYQKRNRLQTSGLSEDCLDYLRVKHILNMPLDDRLGVGPINSAEFLRERRPSSTLYAFATTLLPLPMRKDSAFSESLQIEQLKLGEIFLTEFDHPFLTEQETSQPRPKLSSELQALKPNVSVISRMPEKVSLKTQNPHDGILVGVENTHPFWQAQLDGNPVPIHAWLGTFRSVFVPKGEHTVVFSIDRQMFDGTLALSALTLLFMLWGLCWSKPQ